MAKKIIFVDEDNNEMQCYLNDQGKVFINVGKLDEDMYYQGFITLDKNDVNELISLLSSIAEQMEE